MLLRLTIEFIIAKLETHAMILKLVRWATRDLILSREHKHEEDSLVKFIACRSISLS